MTILDPWTDMPATYDIAQAKQAVLTGVTASRRRVGRQLPIAPGPGPKCLVNRSIREGRDRDASQRATARRRAWARVWGGIHFRSSSIWAAIQGLLIGEFIYDNELRPARKRHYGWGGPRVSPDASTRTPGGDQ